MDQDQKRKMVQDAVQFFIKNHLWYRYCDFVWYATNCSQIAAFTTASVDDKYRAVINVINGFWENDNGERS